MSDLVIREILSWWVGWCRHKCYLLEVNIYILISLINSSIDNWRARWYDKY